jgi:hypothetical protein
MPVLFVLVLVEAVVALVLLGSFLVALSRRKTFRRFWLSSGIVFVLIAAAIVEALMTTPLFDDGPFVGQPCIKEPQGSPDQVFPIADGQLETFDATEPARAPVVRFVDDNRKSLWCIQASGNPKTSVRSIRFHRSRNRFFRIIVSGTVDWTYGHEHTLWYLSGSGMLREYWYSW